MRLLEPNQLVKVILSNGSLGFSPVIGFLDRQTSLTSDFVRLTTESGHSVTLTPYHLLYRSHSNCTSERLPVFAKDISVGDWLLQIATCGGIEPTRVVSVARTVGAGVFAPLTLEGNLVVDNLMASCYAGTENEWLAHSSLLPLRLLYKLRSWVSQWYGWSRPSQPPSDIGIHPYAQFLIWLNNYVQLVQ